VRLNPTAASVIGVPFRTGVRWASMSKTESPVTSTGMGVPTGSGTVHRSSMVADSAHTRLFGSVRIPLLGRSALVGAGSGLTAGFDGWAWEHT
jgi:hypothetical protein